MGRSKDDATDFAQLETADEMPRAKRGKQGMTEPVRQLVDVIADEQVHRIKNVDESNRGRWGRKLRYAAKIADRDVIIVYVDENQEKPSGMYFQGKTREEQQAEDEANSESVE